MNFNTGAVKITVAVILLIGLAVGGAVLSLNWNNLISRATLHTVADLNAARESARNQTQALFNDERREIEAQLRGYQSEVGRLLQELESQAARHAEELAELYSWWQARYDATVARMQGIIDNLHYQLGAQIAYSRTLEWFIRDYLYVAHTPGSVAELDDMMLGVFRTMEARNECLQRFYLRTLGGLPDLEEFWLSIEQLNNQVFAQRLLVEEADLIYEESLFIRNLIFGYPLGGAPWEIFNGSFFINDYRVLYHLLLQNLSTRSFNFHFPGRWNLIINGTWGRFADGISSWYFNNVNPADSSLLPFILQRRAEFFNFDGKLQSPYAYRNYGLHTVPVDNLPLSYAHTTNGIIWVNACLWRTELAYRTQLYLDLAYFYQRQLADFNRYNTNRIQWEQRVSDAEASLEIIRSRIAELEQALQNREAAV